MSYPTHFLVNVEGINSLGSAITSENSIHLNDDNDINDDVIEANGEQPYVETPCRKTCVGNLYAYHIQQFQKIPLNLSRFRVVPAYKAFDSVSQTVNPYYWYSNTDMPSPTQIGPFISGPNGNLTVFGPGGTVLTGLVYGHQKTLGVWEGQSDIETDGQHTIGAEFCGSSHTLNSAITLMNATADFSQPGGLPDYPELECVPANSGGGSDSTSPIGDPTPPKKFKDFVTFCFNPQTQAEEPCSNGAETIIDLLDPEVVDLVFITDLNDYTKTPVIISVAELYNTNNGNGGITNGEFNGFNVTLTPGLYSFGFMFKESGYWAATKEIQTKVDFGLSQADMIEINTFPTPMTGDKYTIEMKAFATLKFNYELRSFTGDLLVSKNFVIHKDHEKSAKMNEKNIPEGFLVHRFIFEDGSVKTIQTLKN